MNHHTITYKPEPEYTAKRAAFDAICTFLVFAFIGGLLAWRG